MACVEFYETDNYVIRDGMKLFRCFVVLYYLAVQNGTEHVRHAESKTSYKCVFFPQGSAGIKGEKGLSGDRVRMIDTCQSNQSLFISFTSKKNAAFQNFPTGKF